MLGRVSWVWAVLALYPHSGTTTSVSQAGDRTVRGAAVTGPQFCSAAGQSRCCGREAT